MAPLYVYVYIYIIGVYSIFCRPYYRALVHIMVNQSHIVRQKAYWTVRQIYRTAGGVSIALPLLQHFSTMLEDQQVFLYHY